MLSSPRYGPLLLLLLLKVAGGADTTTQAARVEEEKSIIFRRLRVILRSAHGCCWLNVMLHAMCSGTCSFLMKIVVVTTFTLALLGR